MSIGHVPFGPGDVTGEVVVARPASTVMLVRSGEDGALEVLMLRKHTRVDFAPGAYVFPGGGLDGSDSSQEISGLCAGRDDAEASALLGVESGGLAYWVAAVRESFEEAGILLAYGPDGSTVSLSDPADEERFRHHRDRLNRGETSLVELCLEEKLCLAVDRIHYFSHWITPEGAPRRYDTRFFVAEVPPDQTALNDGSETVENRWIAPAEALRLGEDGSMALIFPTMKNLEAIRRFAGAAELVAHARVVESVPEHLPRVAVNGREVRILLPGDPGYESVAPLLPNAGGEPDSAADDA